MDKGDRITATAYSDSYFDGPETRDADQRRWGLPIKSFARLDLDHDPSFLYGHYLPSGIPRYAEAMEPWVKQEIDSKNIFERSAATVFASARGVFLAVNPARNDVSGAAYPWRDLDGMGGAVGGTGAALHAAVPVRQPHLLPLHGKHAMGAYSLTVSTADAAGGIVGKRGYIRQIPKIFQWLILFAV